MFMDWSLAALDRIGAVKATQTNFCPTRHFLPVQNLSFLRASLKKIGKSKKIKLGNWSDLVTDREYISKVSPVKEHLFEKHQ